MTDFANDVLNDSLDDFYADFGKEVDVAAPSERKGDLPIITQAIAPMYSEKCPACRGTGRFTSYAGRTVGSCFKCKGTGTLVFKMSPEKRTAAKQYAQKRADRKQDEAKSAAQVWREQNPAASEWLNANATRSEFGGSLAAALVRYGALTEKQTAAIMNSIARDAERKAAAVARTENAPTVSIKPIEDAFESAREKGMKKPSLRLGEFKFSLAPAHGANAGAIYVKTGDQYLGKIMNEKFIRIRECNDEMEGKVIEACINPKEAAIAYGRRTGTCACCGKGLTNHASIDLGIGPICAGKYGW